MTRLAAAWGPPREIESAMPDEIRPGDPLSGDEGIADPATFATYKAWVRPARLDPASFREADDAFLDAYFRVLAGTAPWGATDEAAKRLSIDGPLLHDRRPARPAIEPLSDFAICDLSEDWMPSIGMSAPPRIVGPWALLDPPRRVRVACGAAMAFAPMLWPSIRAMSRPCRSKPKPPVEIRSGLIAALRAPAMLWKPDGAGGLTPLLPMAEVSRPVGVVDGVPDAPYVVGRAVQHPGGWWLSCGLPLPTLPSTRVLERRLRLEYQRLRRHDHRMTWEDMLRDRGEVLYRTACEWLWVHAPDEVWPMWSRWR